MTLKNKRKNRTKTKMQKNSMAYRTKANGRVFSLANANANKVISPWNFLESDWHFALMSVEMQ